MKFEAQVRELGEYNENSLDRLKKEPTVEIEEDEDFCLELEPMEPTTKNAEIGRMNELGE